MSGYPAPNVGAGVEFKLVLSGTGVVAGAGIGEYSLKAAYQSSTVISATVVDVHGTPLGSQPTLTASSTNGDAPSDASENTAMPQPNGGGSTYFGSPVQWPVPSLYALGVYPNSNVASVGAVSGGVATVTINNVGQSIIEFRSPRGTTARLTIQGIQNA
jgi:hypothetical protein